MSTQRDPPAPATSGLAGGAWRLDPSRSTVEFHVRHFYGLMTVKGHFDRYEGALDLAADPAVQLTIAADSLDTGNSRRDAHLRSADFFDVENHPQVLLLSESAALRDDVLTVHGRLEAAGKQVPVDLDAKVSFVEGEPEIEAVTHADHRVLGMTWSPIGILRAPSELVVRGRLIR